MRRSLQWHVTVWQSLERWFSLAHKHKRTWGAHNAFVRTYFLQMKTAYASLKTIFSSLHTNHAVHLIDVQFWLPSSPAHACAMPVYAPRMKETIAACDNVAVVGSLWMNSTWNVDVPSSWSVPQVLYLHF